MSDEDPLEHADVGERQQIEETQVIEMYYPDVCIGTDRDADDVELSEAEIVEGEYGPQIHATWEGELMKTLPPSWDQHNKPVTEREEKKERRKKWLGRFFIAGATVLSMGIAFAVTWPLMPGMSDVTINGEPMGPVTPFDFIPVVLLMVFILAIVVFVLPYMPRPGPGRVGR